MASSSSSDRSNIAHPRLSRQNITNSLLSEQGCTKTALANVLWKLQQSGAFNIDCGFGESHRATKRKLSNALRDRASDATGPYGPIVKQMTLYPGFEWSYICPFAWLHFLTANCKGFSSAMRDCIGNGTSPLRLIVYIDELCPGNPLRPEKARTLQSIYYVFVDFPAWVLQRSDCWQLFGVLKSTIAASLPGGVSGLMKRVMHILFAASGPSFSTGTLIVVDDRTELVCRALFAGFLCDEKAHKEILSVKGASGTKPCVTCMNVVRLIDVSKDDYLRDITCSRLDELRYHTDASFYEMIDELRTQEPLLSKRKFESLQQAMGILHDPDSLLYDDSLREIIKPVTHCLRDWCHVLCSGGAAGTEIALLLQVLQDNGVQLQQIAKYTEAFTLPKSRGKVPRDWLTKNRIGEEQMRTPSASAHITMVSLLRCFLEDVVEPTGILLQHTQCFKLLSAIMDRLCAGADGAMRFVDELKVLIQTHHALFVVLYADSVKPKLHNLLHLPENMESLGKLVACWVTERKHRSIKSAALHSFRHVETTVTVDIVNRMTELYIEDEHLFSRNSMIGGTSVSTSGFNIDVSNAMRCACGELHAGDLVRFASGGYKIGKIKQFYCVRRDESESWFAAQIGVHQAAGLHRYDCESDRTSFIAVEDICQPLAWAADGNQIRVALPLIDS